MRTKLKMLTLAVVGSIAMTASAVAATSVMGVDQNGDAEGDVAITVAQEYLNFKTATLNNGDTRILYIPIIGLGQDNTIKVEFAGGGIATNENNEIYVTDKDGNLVGQMIDFGTATAPDGTSYYTWILLKFSQPISANTPLFINMYDNDGDAATPLVPSPLVILPGASKLTAQVTEAYDSTSTPLEAPKTAPVTIAQASAQFDVTIEDYIDNNGDNFSDRVIDVNAERKAFVALPVSGDTQTSKVAVTIKANDLNYDIFDFEENVNSYKIVLKGDFSAFANVVSEDADGGEATCNLVDSNTIECIDDNADNEINVGGSEDKDIVGFTIDGETVLSPQNISAEVSIDTTLGDAYEIAGPEKPDAIRWGINGAQFKISYLFDSPSVFVRIANEAAIDGTITVDLFDENGNSITGVDLGTVPGKGGVVITADQIVAAAKAKGWNPTSPRFTAKFTVTIPADQVTAVAVMRMGDNDRVIPVLTSNDNTWKE